jgi:hypothetical protein
VLQTAGDAEQGNPEGSVGEGHDRPPAIGFDLIAEDEDDRGIQKANRLRATDALSFPLSSPGEGDPDFGCKIDGKTTSSAPVSTGISRSSWPAGPMMVMGTTGL